MKRKDVSVEDLIAEVNALLEETAPVDETQVTEPKQEKENIEAAAQKEAEAIYEAQEEQPVKKRSVGKVILTVIGRLLVFLLTTVLLVAVGLYGVMYILAKGPSPTARDLFVMSVRETSAVGFLAELFFTEEEIAQIEQGKNEEVYEDTDTSLIQITQPPEVDEELGPQPDAWGLIDEDGDGIIVEEVKGEGYSGYMMVVLDPSRVIMGCVPESFTYQGYTVAEMVERYDAVAGTNAGGFLDPNGQGNGSIPDTMVVFEGEVYYAEHGTRSGFVGFDSNHVMHVGNLTAAEIKERDIQYGVCFGPVLVSNGEPCETGSRLSGVNPRTAIGQRADGAVLLLVIDGRQVISLGATYEDLIDIFLSYGAVNACNLDGGSSSLMWYQGDYINNCASLTGVRPVPTTILVLKEGVDSND